MSFEFPHVILKLSSISAIGGTVCRYWNVNTSVMVVITIVSFCLLFSGAAYRILNVLSHHFNLNSVFHDKGRVMVLCVIMFTW